MLTKSNGKTKDTRGCEFHYQRLHTRQFNASKCITEEFSLYVCIEFPSVTSNSLKELKIKMGEI